jgi:hypothetical protein
LKGVLYHQWQIGSRLNTTVAYHRNFEEFIADVMSRAPKSPDLDTVFVRGELKITDAMCLREESRRHVESKEFDTGCTVCELVFEWPAVRKRAKMYAYSFDGSKEWWFWPTLDPDNKVPTFDLKENATDEQED